MICKSHIALYKERHLPIDPEFGVEVKWDTFVLDGYPWVHLPNRSPVPGIGRFFGLFNPGVWRLIRKVDSMLSFCPAILLYCLDRNCSSKMVWYPHLVRDRFA